MFQKIVEQKYLKSTTTQDELENAWQKYSATFLNAEKQKHIRESKEEQYQEGFIRDLFCEILGYTINPEPNYNIITEKKNDSDSRKADGAIIINGNVKAVIELKGSDTTDLSKVENQAFGYKAHNPSSHYVIISNFEKLRFYIEDASSFLEFPLFTLPREQFNLLYLCLSLKNITDDIPLKMKTETVSAEISITDKFYADYSTFKRNLFEDICQNNLEGESLPLATAGKPSFATPSSGDTPQRPAADKLLLFKKTQKLLDRILFILFCEDRGLLPENSVNNLIIGRWQKLKEIDAYQPLYESFKNYFNRINTGWKSEDGKTEIFAYNGGLFKPDDILDNIKISDDVLFIYSKRIAEYDFVSEVSVNILGHIFEHSLSEIDEITNQITSGNTAEVSKRKKDGVFYTPAYITKYIVENTVGALCDKKKAELGIDDETFSAKRRTKTKIAELDKNLADYRAYLLSLKILDPACGSGAFLNAAYEFLLSEHHLIDELYAKLHGDLMNIFEVDNDILEHNLYGVDINEESVEIAKLSLWLHTAKKGRKLTSLNNNIKCGNSLIDDESVAGEKAFNWEKEFPQVFTENGHADSAALTVSQENKGFDVVIGNPPYVRLQTLNTAYPDLVKCYNEKYSNYVDGNYDIYILFLYRGYCLLKKNGRLGFIQPNKFFTAEAGSKIRSFFAKSKSIIEIDNFTTNLVFDSAAIYTALFFLENAQQSNFLYREFKLGSNFKDINSLPPLTFEQDELNKTTWNFANQTVDAVLSKIKNQVYTLEKITEKIFKGSSTGNDKIFLLELIQDKGEIVSVRSELVQTPFDIEKDILRPFVYGEDIKRYLQPKPQKYLLFPYETGMDGNKTLLTISKLEEKYPLAFNYLRSQKEILLTRKIPMTNENYFKYSAARSLNEYEHIKILIPDMLVKNRISYDKTGMIFHGPAIHSLVFNEIGNKTDLQVYLSILNSDLFWFFIVHTSTAMNSDTYRLTPEYVAPFGIPDVSDVSHEKIRVTLSSLADKMLSLNADLQTQTKEFTRLVQNNLNIEKLSTIIQNFTALTFADFLKETAKLKNKDGAKAKIPLKDQSEWNEAFDTFKEKCLSLQQQIATTDAEINAKVYKLYGLTNDEIKTVERK